jgi:hypothetical protein
MTRRSPSQSVPLSKPSASTDGAAMIVNEMLERHWRECFDRGDKPRPVFAVFEPATGKVVTFGTRAKDMREFLASKPNTETLRLVKIEAYLN